MLSEYLQRKLFLPSKALEKFIFTSFGKGEYFYIAFSTRRIMGRSLSAMLVWFLFLASVGNAALLQGTVYDFSLTPVENVVVEVDSVPVQKMVVQDGKYQFQVPSGAYTLTVKGGQGLSTVLAEEHAQVAGDGVFTIDIVLFPELNGNGNELLEDPAGELSGLLEEKDSFPWRWMIGLVIILGVGFFVWKRMQKPERKEEEITDDAAALDRILKILKEEQGRMTQKDLRKRVPYSEAKLSLMVTELEAKGKIEKIKKGRGNVLVLK